MNEYDTADENDDIRAYNEKMQLSGIVLKKGLTDVMFEYSNGSLSLRNVKMAQL